MKYLNLFIVLILLYPVFSKAQITQNVSFSTQDLEINHVEVNNDNYVKIDHPSLMVSGIAGEPELPIAMVNLIIPFDKKVDKIITSSSESASFNLDYYLYPCQNPIPTQIGYSVDTGFVSIDTITYTTNGTWPSRCIRKENISYFDANNKILSIEICPFEYYPTQNKLTFINSIDIEVILKNDDDSRVIEISRLARTDQFYKSVLNNIVSNNGDIEEYSTENKIVSSLSSFCRSIPTYEYVVIAPSAYANSFNNFVEWKRKKGLFAGVVTKEDIFNNYSGDEIFTGDEIYDEAGKIRQYLYEAYQNGTAWALLVGDISIMPVRFGWRNENSTDFYEIIPTDLYFADFDGNWNVDGDNCYGEEIGDSPDYSPEIYVGRLLCSSEQDITNWLTKLEIYEKNPGNGDPSYLTESFMFQADQLQQYDQATEIANHLPMFDHEIWEEYPSYFSTNPSFPKGADVLNEVNTTHYGLMSWFGHGGTGGQNSGVTTLSSGVNGQPYWKLDAEDAYEYYNVVPEVNDGLDNLSNFNHPFMIYSISCTVTPFDVTKSTGNSGARNCGESFTVNNLGGGIAFLGNTRYGYVDQSFNLYKLFSDMITSSDTYSEYAHIGVSEFASKQSLSSHYISYTHNIIGDPETKLWTDTPEVLTVDIQPSHAIENFNNTIQVTVEHLEENKQALVTLYKNGDFLENITVTGNSSEIGLATFTNIIPSTTDDIYATVTAHNYFPVEETIPVISDCVTHITSNEIWDTDRTIVCDIVLESGVTLTISSSITALANVSIIVEQGARLVIDGGSISSSVSQWQGIEVWGYRDESQMECVNTGMTCHQGYLELKNGAVIENAKVAVTLWNPDHYGQTGGIVIAEDATFRNNAKSVHAMYYQNFNPVNPTTEMQTVSHFYNCTFEITDEYEGATFYKHADLAEVNGILFKGCDFSVDPDAQDVSPYCSAIAAYDAGFKVEEKCLNSNTNPCSNMDKSTFTGFYTAIDARSTGVKSYTFNVHNSEFYNNTNGIVCSNIDNAAILFNKFYIGQNNADKQRCSSATGTGVYMNYSTGFAIEENDFLLATGAPSGDYIGIRIEETEGVDEIYKNTFDGLTYANFAEGVNYDSYIYHGLAYYCNDNTNNYADFFVADSYIDGIQSDQGNDYLVTGNTFSPSGATWHFYNGGGHLIGYYYCNSCSNENPDDGKIYRVTEHPKSLTNDCDSHYGGSATRSVSLTEQEVEEAEQKYYEAYSNYSNVELLYNAYKDGGSTPNELEAVETAQPSDMWELRATLLGDSPHLSLEVLKETADRTDVFSDQALFDILSANPDELKKDELIKYLEEKEDPLPDYMIEILKQVAEGSTYKTVLINQLSEYAFKKAEAANDIIRSLLNEETPDMEALRNWLDNLGGTAADRQIISTYMHEDNYADALTLANMLPALYNLTGDELNDHYDYVEMIGLFKELYEEDRTIHQLTESESDQLKLIIENNYGSAAATAKNIMSAINDEHFYNCPNLNEDLENKSQLISMDDWAKTKGTSVVVSPNPAKEWVTFDYTLSGDESIGIIILANSQGKIIRNIEISGSQGQKLVDTRNLPSGTYFYTLNSEGMAQTGKLVITK